MFERFTKPARVIVRDAVHIAEQEEAALIRPEHLLLAMLAQVGSRSAQILADHGVTTDTVRQAIDIAHRRGGLSSADAAALEEVGIDIDAVVTALEQSHGEGVLTPPKRARTFGPRWRVPFAAESKKVLEQSLREALANNDKTIGDEHVLLALLATNGIAADVLTAQGVTQAVVKAYLKQAG